jgi:nitroreductase
MFMKLDSEDGESRENFRSLQRIAEQRRSVRRFTSRPIRASDMQEILDLGLLAPTSSNLQPFELFWVRSPERHAPLVAACLSQSAAREAQELVVCIARWDLWNVTRAEYLRFLENQSGIHESVLLYYRRLAQAYYGQGPLSLFGLFKWMGASAFGLLRPTVRFPFSQSDMRVWAMKSAALVCENVMLAAAAKGIDSCAMEGNDPVRVGRVVGMKRWRWKRGWDVVMVLAFGYRDPQTGILGQRWRRERGELIKEI